MDRDHRLLARTRNRNSNIPQAREHCRKQDVFGSINRFWNFGKTEPRRWPILILVLSEPGQRILATGRKARKMPSAALSMELMLMIHRQGCLLAPSHVKRDLNQWALLTHSGFSGFTPDKRLSVLDAWRQFELVASILER